MTVRMDSIGHRFPAGSRIRLSLSPCYWPLAWPSPEPVTLDVRHGGETALVLPERPPRAEDERLRPLDEPEEPEPLATSCCTGSSGGVPPDRARPRDAAARSSIFDWDCGGRTRLPNGLEYEDTSRGDVLDRRGRSALGARARREHVRTRPRRLAGLDPRRRHDDVHRDDVRRQLRARGRRGRDARVRAHVDARVPARLLG